MEAAGQTPHVAVDAAELTHLFEGGGPVATVFLITESAVENAAQRSEVRWKNLRRTMADEGVPDAVLTAVDPLVPDAHLEGEMLGVIVGNDGDVRVVEHFPDPPLLEDRFRWGPLPWAGPFVEARQAAVPHVVVTVDRLGAEIVLIRGGRLEADEQVTGDDYPISKTKPGGWSQRRYQQRAENTWAENADNVAEAVTELVRRSGARLVVAVGDVRAVQLLRDALPEDVAARLEVAEGDPADETARLVSSVAAHDTVELLRKFKEELGQADRAADGVAATVTALNQSQVEVLLVHEDPDDARTAWCGPDPVPVSTQPSDLKDLGVDSPVEAPLCDVLLRAAVGTGAGVRMIPGTPLPRDGVGAILRWAG